MRKSCTAPSLSQTQTEARFYRIRDYLIGSNVQLGASYKVGQASTSRVAEGFEAGAKYINAAKDEIGKSNKQ
jgi:hypothetical protein